ncbi:hypothetical protein P3X46_005507 [Hevea brasiliensis]|uniref:Uncharacterized protein n=1 Tax=Hevea brasiliensis TaxID=3981 RepID=A0ABQ9N2H0_HEVBR|nr:hypothetical protein P3X46_005507 [Hevea brasiliensis]
MCKGNKIMKTASIGGAQEWRNFNGHLVNCDTWMNIHLPVVICTSKVIDKVQEETKSHSGMVSGYILFITAEVDVSR